MVQEVSYGTCARHAMPRNTCEDGLALVRPMGRRLWHSVTPLLLLQPLDLHLLEEHLYSLTIKITIVVLLLELGICLDLACIVERVCRTSRILHLQKERKASFKTTWEIMHGIQGTWASSWLQVDLLRVKQPSSRVPSAASIDVASNWLLGNRDHSLEGVEAWQSAKGTPTLAVLRAAIAVTVAQSP